ncbi:Nuclear envelope morphology protein 1 [Coccidioides posadasii str. Silveira]|uniref:NIF domain-containing protein n=3 Tax=Coccidioides posadasii TaxID=199306 RepID=E9CRR8_COCPS|nr:NLI interacting factor-like phosphatase family protein [Coccidioides posadasii C735 delta SOWgp]EER28122.1 NLI interacting factor-like phosphatase family protein [Coccidioides posadasii C735 delta SOWgp]EFW23293.1 NIF domain-containing protein [Coccidioides posadasii str. Silveira]QVM12154.1 Nuclear envelope morphology protein 1 [Coccidioides posadasii str. Silveira]|eukprot:XP_003070267.1 NLI interacting factor-like phosphatase family protein [Coccidioides posadasii C735 delta SOWgp]
MNSLNILSSRVIGQTTPSSSRSPSRSRSRSHSQGPTLSGRSALAGNRSYSEGNLHDIGALEGSTEEENNSSDQPNDVAPTMGDVEEKAPLLHGLQKDGKTLRASELHAIAQQLVEALAETLSSILYTLASPAIYLVRTFRDDNGRYSPLNPVRRMRLSGSESRKNAMALEAPGKTTRRSRSGSMRSNVGYRNLRTSPSRESMSSMSSNASESDIDRTPTKAGRRHSRSKSEQITSIGNEVTPRRSIRIQIQNGRKGTGDKVHRRRSSELRDTATNVAAESLKSPISPSIHRLTKYPHAPAPPRPLIPPRQPSYAPGSGRPRFPQKTLILDLDETLIHSLAKGGRMSSGHMVEVRLSTPMTTSTAPGGASTTLGPQHPILYYVHKRPHCDVFLRKVCKWYKLVVFTASVQEYADPVIDWLEQERKFFHSRYYRQHCTLRNGAYIKDLSSVEPDLSKVMILDNSPMSYIFHEDNAIPIEGWINDPTDNDLLHLIPLLEAMQYVTDVRALLALRRGEAMT